MYRSELLFNSGVISTLTEPNVELKLRTNVYSSCIVMFYCFVVVDLRNEPCLRADAVRGSQRRCAEAEIKLNAHERF